MQDYLISKNDYKPVTFWSLNDKLNIKELKNQLDKFAAAGFGGVFLHSRVGLITLYMSESWLNLIDFCVDYGTSLGLNIYLYDEDMWPSGYGGGLVAKKDISFHEKCLTFIDKNELTYNDTVIETLNDKLIVKRISPSGYTRFNGECFIDEMNPYAVKYFFSVIHEKYFSKMKKKFGTSIKGIFTDEPCYNLHSFHTGAHIPYSEYAVQRFEKENGICFAKNAHKLFIDTVDCKSFRLKYYDALSKQFNEAFTKQYKAWCNYHGIKLVGHFMAEETLREQIQYTGGVMENYKDMDIPGVDKLFRPCIQLVTLKQLTSVCEIFNKPRALSECFAGMGQESTFFDRKKVIDWQAVNGINFVNTHLSHYSMRGERKRDYPANLNYQQPFFFTEKTVNDYIARLSYISGLGKRKVSVCILQPYSSAVVSYDPNNTEKELDEDKFYLGVAEILQKNLIDFHIVSEIDFEKYAIILKNKVSIMNYSYDTVILPNNKNISNINYQKLSLFKGNIITVGDTLHFIDGINHRCKIGTFSFSDLISFEEYVKNNIEKIYPIKGGENKIIAVKRELLSESFLIIANFSEEKVEISLNFSNQTTIVSLFDGKEYLCDKIIKVNLFSHGLICLHIGSNYFENNKKFIFNDGFELTKSVFEKIKFELCNYPINNLLLIDKVNFFYEDKTTGFVPINHIWHYIFYKLNEGTPFKAEYKFYTEYLPQGNCFVLIENAENYDQIKINGIIVSSKRNYNENQICDNKCYKDISLTKVDISDKIIVGENCIQICGKKYNNINDVCGHRWVYTPESYAATEVESIYILGDFSVKLVNNTALLCEKKKLFLGDISQNGYPFYSGELKYRINAKLKCGDIIKISGYFAAISICEKDDTENICSFPYIYTVKYDCDSLDIKVYNTLYNMYGPHHIKDYKKKLWIDPGIFNDINNVDESYRIEKFGINTIERIKK